MDIIFNPTANDKNVTIYANLLITALKTNSFHEYALKLFLVYCGFMSFYEPWKSSPKSFKYEDM